MFFTCSVSTALSAARMPALLSTTHTKLSGRLRNLYWLLASFADNTSCGRSSCSKWQIMDLMAESGCPKNVPPVLLHYTSSDSQNHNRVSHLLIKLDSSLLFNLLPQFKCLRHHFSIMLNIIGTPYDSTTTVRASTCVTQSKLAKWIDLTAKYHRGHSKTVTVYKQIKMCWHHLNSTIYGSWNSSSNKCWIGIPMFVVQKMRQYFIRSKNVIECQYTLT